MPARPSPTRLLRIGTAAAAAGLVLVLGGCSSDPSTPRAPHTSAPAPSPTHTRPLLTVQQADQIVDRYQQVNTVANARQDATLLGTVKAGSTFELSRADYKQWSTFSAKEKKEYLEPWSYTQRTYYIPAQGKATWFMMRAHTTAQGKPSKNPSLAVFDNTDGKGFKLVFSVHGIEGNLPAALRGPDGLVTPVPATATSGSLAPRDVTASFEDLYATGGQQEGTRIDRTTPSAKTALKIYKERNKALGPKGGRTRYFAAKPTHPEVYALKAGDGVLALVPLAHTSELMVTNSGLQISPSKVEKLYEAKTGPIVTDVFHGQAAAYLPVRGNARVLGFTYSVVDAH
ncbi:hypothetical protein ACWKT5_26705 [Streptomyces avermitilis]